MLIDTHCHLNFQAFAKDLSNVVRRAKEAEVEKMIVPGTDLVSSQRALEISQQFPGVCYAAIGLHPHHAQDPNQKIDQDLKQKLEKLIRQGSRNVVAIGEIGLDYHEYQKTKYENKIITEEIKTKQKQLLLMQMDLALIHNLPVIFHCREAWPDMIQTISSFAKAMDDRSSFIKSTDNRSSFAKAMDDTLSDRENISRTHPPLTNYIKPNQLKGVFHCFSGSTADLSLLTTMGYNIGFDGNITYSTDYSTLVALTPLNKILLETDSPLLSPVPYRGQRNEPKNVQLVAEAVAKYRSCPPAEVINTSTINAKSLFSI